MRIDVRSATFKFRFYNCMDRSDEADCPPQEEEDSFFTRPKGGPGFATTGELQRVDKVATSDK